MSLLPRDLDPTRLAESSVPDDTTVGTVVGMLTGAKWWKRVLAQYPRAQVRAVWWPNCQDLPGDMLMKEFRHRVRHGQACIVLEDGNGGRLSAD